jgi:hypothetical protein
MSRISRLVIVAVSVLMLFALWPARADAQHREGRRPSPPPRHAAVAVRGEFIFIGGYFYDPFFGPYPWWTRGAYSRRYFPAYDYRAEVRVMATPRDAAVYVDGFYAGIVDDFDGVFQHLLLPPGGHTIVLYLEGYRTVRHDLYLRPDSTLKLHDTLERLPAGVAGEPPPVASTVPPPPAGSYRLPRTPPRASLPPPAPEPFEEGVEAAGFGTLDLRIQPADAAVTIDGQPWLTSEAGHFLIEVAEGSHRVEVSKQGYRRFSTEITVSEGKTMPLNVSLSSDKP